MVGNRSSLLQYNNVKVIPKSIMYGEKQRAGRPRPYDLSFVDGLRGLCVVGIVYCLNQDFQDYRIFRIGRGLYTFRTAGVWNVGFRSSTQPTRLHKLKVYATRCGENLPIETCKIAQTESLCYKMRREPTNRNLQDCTN